MSPSFWVLACLVILTEAVPISLYGLNYNTRKGPDWDPAKCKSRQEVLEDLRLLGQITSRIRILSLVDCGQGEIVASVSKELGLSVWLGLWVSDDENVFLQEKAALETMLEAGTIDDSILGISVGSEAVYRGDVSSDQIVEHKNEVKDLLMSYDLPDLPVAICDVDDIYEQNLNLFASTDIVVANAFPFWENTPVDIAADYLVNTKMPDVLSLAGIYNKSFILGETGWSEQGDHPSASEATPENQFQFFQDFFCLADKEENWAYYYFTGIDNEWRIAQEMDEEGVEGHFGIFYANLTMKAHFRDMVFTCPGSTVSYSFEVDSVQRTTSPTASPIETFPPAKPFTTEASPTPEPDDSPTVVLSESCLTNQECVNLNLTGACCPTEDGIYLGCCDTIPTEGPTFSSPPSSAPSLRPTDGSESPSAIPTLEPPSSVPSLEPSRELTASPTVAAPNLTVEPSPPLSGMTSQEVTDLPTGTPLFESASPSLDASDAPTLLSEDPTTAPGGGNPSDSGVVSTNRPTVSTTSSAAVRVSSVAVPMILCGAMLHSLW